MDLPAAQVAVRDRLVEALKADLVGPMAEGEVLEGRPSRWYIAGYLAPRSSAEVEEQDPLLEEGLSLDADRGEDSEVEQAPPHPLAPSSIGLSFLVGPDVRRVEICVEWADYLRISEEETRAFKELERQRRQAKRRARRGAEAPEEAAEEPQEPEEPEEESRPRFRYWRRGSPRRERRPLELPVDWAELPLDQDPQLLLRLVSRAAPEGQGPPGTRVISAFLINAREPLRSHSDERYIFQVRLSIGCPQGFYPRVQRDPSDHRDDRRNDLQFRDLPVWAVGHGVATEVEEGRGPGGERRCEAISTCWVPTARVHRMKARDLAGVTTSMEALAALPGAAALTGSVSALLEAYAGWIGDQAARGQALPLERHRQTAAELAEEAELARRRIASGLARLQADALAWRAFQLTCRAMAGAARQQRPHEEPRWRLFQLAFLLLNIDGVCDPEHADRRRVELLFFPTGGGKTEAYLGVAAFTLFLRRLRGASRPDGGLGVGVLLRYTLRLLTLDQLKRAAQLICAMELERRRAPEALGRARYSVGVWVGRSATANTLEDLKPTIRKLRDGHPLLGSPRPLPLEDCPWCGKRLGRGAFALVPGGKSPHALLVTCDDEDCPFHVGQGEDLPEHRRGLPVVAVDEHVYRELPSILIGTVDKFASLPWRGASGAIFGRVRAVGRPGEPDEGAFYGHHEKPPTRALPLPQGLLAPELIIQDELHLITGPLGTMVGLYETMIDALCSRQHPQGAKLIASTATARRATEQIQALFARSAVHLFPAQGIDDGDTFFAESDLRPEKARLYVGAAAPGLPYKQLAARIYTCLLGATQQEWLAAGRPGRRNPADTYMSLVAYFNALRELGGAQRMLQEEVNTRTRQLSERRPLDQERSERYADRTVSYELPELTSRQSTDQIKKYADQMAEPYAEKGKARTDVVLASNMISVGIDIPRLGLMVVNGQPRTVAEYIQASSRVGRESPGLVVTAFSLHKARDRSHYESFESFHASFYRGVEAATVTPFSARAVDRGLAGLVAGLARHLPERMARPDGAMQLPHEAGLPLQLRRLLAERVQAHREGVSPELAPRVQERLDYLLKTWTAIVRDIEEKSGRLYWSPWEAGTDKLTLLHTAVDDIASGENSERLAEFRSPTSMRDVEPSVHIWLDLNVHKGTK